MAYELTFYVTTPGRPYSETGAPATTTPGSSGNNIVIGQNSSYGTTIDDDDAWLDQVGFDGTPAVLREALQISTPRGDFNYPPGTEIALSPPLIFTTQINGVVVSVKMQGLLVKEDGVWKSALNPSPTSGYPGLYIFSKNVPEGDPDYGKPLALPPGTYTIKSPSQNASATHIAYEGEPDTDAPPCFTLGTLIETPEGLRPVEALQAGDRVLTRDHGPQVLLWAGRQHLAGGRLVDAPNLRPVRIAAGALGPGCPARDLVVSPQHRMLLDSRIIARLGAADEVLVPACQLIGWPGIEALPAETGVTYLHLLLDRHEVLRAEGAWTESLYLGPELRKRRTPMAREIAALFPELLSETHPLPEPARIFMRGRRLRELLRRAQKNGRDLVEGKGADHKGGRTSRAVPAELV